MSTETFSGEVFMHSDTLFTLIPALRSHRFYHFVNINIDKYRRRAGYWEVVQDCLNPSEGIHAEMEDERRSGYPGSPWKRISGNIRQQSLNTRKSSAPV